MPEKKIRLLNRDGQKTNSRLCIPQSTKLTTKFLRLHYIQACECEGPL